MHQTAAAAVGAAAAAVAAAGAATQGTGQFQRLKVEDALSYLDQVQFYGKTINPLSLGNRQFIKET